MRLKNVFVDLVALILIIPVVILIFRLIHDRKIAAVLAGALFVGIPLILMGRRWRRPLRHRQASIVWWAGVAGFWILFAIPILSLRLASWETPFAKLEFAKIPAPQLHHASNFGFVIMLIAVAVAGWMSPSRK